MGHGNNFSQISDAALDNLVRQILTSAPQSGIGLIRGALHRHQIMVALQRLDQVMSAQKVLFNGRKQVLAIKFQSVVAPNDLIVDLFGPMEGRRHDSGMLAMSGLLPMLETHCITPFGQPLCLYGDPA